jgi:DNA-binding PadR family transcriptional regulator
MQMTSSMRRVLSAIGAGHYYGYAIASELGMAHGTIYAVLKKLRDGGYVISRADVTEEGLPCRSYELHPDWLDRFSVADAGGSRGTGSHV